MNIESECQSQNYIDDDHYETMRNELNITLEMARLRAEKIKEFRNINHIIDIYG